MAVVRTAARGFAEAYRRATDVWSAPGDSRMRRRRVARADAERRELPGCLQTARRQASGSSAWLRPSYCHCCLLNGEFS
jgi:hypothetical protein